MKINFLTGRFAQEPLFKISNDETASIRKHYRSFIVLKEGYLDDITWNDVDLDEMYQKMNATYSCAGDMMLYGMLRQPCTSSEELAKRYAIMNWAKTHEDEREEVIEILYNAGKRYDDDVDRPILENHTNPMRKRISQIFVYGMYLSLLPLLFIRSMYVFVPVAFLLANIFRYWVLHKNLEHFIDPLVSIVSQVEALHKLANCKFTDLAFIEEDLKQMSKRLKRLHTKASFGYYESTAGMFTFLTQGESIHFDDFANMVYQGADDIRDAFMLIGMIDACISAASYQLYEKVNDDVTLQESGRFMQAQEMVHPFVEHCVANDIDIQENRLLTGSNATGKSTYLKMVVLNCIMAQSFHIVFAKKYQACFFTIATSMSIHDSIERSESTFMAEIKSIKHLMDSCSDKTPALCVIDEILRGTNTLERIAASSVILQDFARSNCICLGATHDMELTDILQGDYQNYHFSETMKGEQMVFDYKIHKGPTTTRNAIQLLKMFKYKDALIKQASSRLKRFETTGEWEIIA